jgi:hypothetical protein
MRASDLTDARDVAVLLDYLVYVVVLNIFVQFVPQVITESFSVSLLTAALLLLVLHGVTMVKVPLTSRFKTASSRTGKVLLGLALWIVLAGSKFVVLALVDRLFGDRVSLGGFVSVTGLILVLLFARDLVRSALAAVLATTPTAG